MRKQTETRQHTQEKVDDPFTLCSSDSVLAQLCGHQCLFYLVLWQLVYPSIATHARLLVLHRTHNLPCVCCHDPESRRHGLHCHCHGQGTQARHHDRLIGSFSISHNLFFPLPLSFHSFFCPALLVCLNTPDRLPFNTLQFLITLITIILNVMMTK